MLGFILKDQDLVAWYVTEVHILNHMGNSDMDTVKNENYCWGIQQDGSEQQCRRTCTDFCHVAHVLKLIYTVLVNQTTTLTSSSHPWPDFYRVRK